MVKIPQYLTHLNMFLIHATLYVRVSTLMNIPRSSFNIMQVRKRFEAGNPDGAKQAARTARSWAIAGVVFGLVNLVFNIVVTILFFKGVGIFGDMKEQMGF